MNHRIFGKKNRNMLNDMFPSRWSRDKAIDYLTDHTAMTQIQAEQEVDRYITWPGQACAYKIGEIVILKLRRHAEKVLGRPCSDKF